MGRICVRCDGLVGPCMVGFGAAWMLLHGCMYNRDCSILDNHYNSNFLGVDVNGRCSYIFGALYRHQNCDIFTHEM